MKKNSRPWQQGEVVILLDMRDNQKCAFEKIDVALGRPPGSSRYKYMRLRDGKEPSAGPTASGGRVELSPAQLAARAARTDAANRMTLTATFFGDPPPGYSALDRRPSP